MTEALPSLPVLKRSTVLRGERPAVSRPGSIPSPRPGFLSALTQRLGVLPLCLRLDAQRESHIPTALGEARGVALSSEWADVHYKARIRNEQKF
jgi:hypothetical protein